MLETGAISVARGVFDDIGGADVDLSGYLVLPGIIDLHGDAFERHVAPRYTAPFPIATGLLGTDRDCAASGVTTAWIAQSWSWEGGVRGPDYAVRLMDELAGYRATALTDLRLQVRCETHTMDHEAQLIEAVRRFGVDYVVFNNHLVEIDHASPEDMAMWAKKAGRSAGEHEALMREMIAREGEVPGYLGRLSEAFAALGVKTGSHDDEDAAMRARFRAIGAPISEFPTSFEAAEAARAHGEPILMGAPNVARGGSQSGKISAMELIKAGLCDALVSDYFYTAMADAAFRVADEGVLPLAEAWALISSNAARVMGLEDRGLIAPQMRVDLTVIDAETRRVEATMVGGRFTYLAGEVATRVVAGGRVVLAAAE